MEPKAKEQPLEPTASQKFFASQWPDIVWFGGSAILGSVTALWLAGSGTVLVPDSFAGVVWFTIVASLGFATGFCLAAFPGCFVYGPTIYDRSLKNGAPFRIGDKVRIIGGKNDGLVRTVYANWQGDSVRVELDDAAAQDLSDVYHPTQLLRVSGSQNTDEPIPAQHLP